MQEVSSRTFVPASASARACADGWAQDQVAGAPNMSSPSPAGSRRQRQKCWEGTPAELAALLQPLATSVNFVKYGDDMQKTRADPGKLVAHAPLVMKLRQAPTVRNVVFRSRHPRAALKVQFFKLKCVMC